MAATSEFRFDGSVRTVVGNALTGLSVAVLSQPAVTTTQPGSPLISLFAAAITNSAALSSASWLLGVMTMVFSAPPPADVVAGSYIQITGVNPTGYNGVWLVVSVNGNNVVVTTPYTLAAPANPGGYVSGGTVATSALPNPFLTDNLGNFFFYAPAGTYTIQIFGTALTNQLVFTDQAVLGGGAGTGTVTSVGLTMPAEFTVGGSPIIGAGTIAVTKANENANQGFFGPTSGVPAQPTFRALVTADLPAGTGTVTSIAITLTVPAALLSAAVAGSPLTTNGTIGLTLTLQNQNANLVFAGPTSGGAAAPTFRTLVAADMPSTVLATLSTTLSSAQILALLGTPVTLVPAPGAGFVIVPLTIVIVFFGGTVAYTDAGGAVEFTLGSQAPILALATNGIFLVTTSPNKAIQRFPIAGATDTAGNPPTDDNAPLQITKITNNFAAGNGTAKVIVQYYIVPTT
jgi:hypothetical protein